MAQLMRSFPAYVCSDSIQVTAMPRITTSLELPSNVLFSKYLRLRSQHCRPIRHTHVHLFLADRYQTFGKVCIILLQKPDG